MTKLKTFYNLGRKPKQYNLSLKKCLKAKIYPKEKVQQKECVESYKLTLVVKTSFSNVFFHLTNRKGKILYSLLGGNIDAQSKQKRRSRAVSMALLEQLILYLQRTQTQKVALVVLGFSPLQLPTLVSQIIKRLKKEKIKTIFLKDSTSIAHNGCRLAKHRRGLDF